MNIYSKKFILAEILIFLFVFNFPMDKSIGKSINDPSMRSSGNAGVLARLEITNIPVSVQAGQQFSDTLLVTAYNQYGQIEITYAGTVTWNTSDTNEEVLLPVDDGTGWDNGTKKFAGALFKLCTAGTQWLSVSDGSISSTNYSLTVEPASLDSFQISGVPENVEAGSYFNSDIEITAYDMFGNVKKDYQGDVEWISSDGLPYPAVLPVDDGTGWNNGTKIFSGLEFQLFNGPEQTITVQDQGVTATSDPITVLPTDLNDFSFQGIPPTPVVAGQQFSYDITVSAYDEYNNLKTDYTGIIRWSSSDTDPYRADLPYDNGAGWSNGSKTFMGSSFKLYNTPSQTLTVTDETDESVTTTSNIIQVLPGELGDFTIEGLPDQRTAGQRFYTGITVTAYDSYTNQKTDYEGIIIWSSSDKEPYPADLPTDNGDGWDNGRKTFFGSSFTLYNSPQQTFTVTDGATSTTSNPVTVMPAALDTFSLSCNSIQTAGIPFALTATDAQDEFENNWEGIVSVSSSILGGNSPNGSSPILEDIELTNGSGQADQILVKAESGVELKGTANGISSFVSNITVNPGSLSQLKIKDSPSDAGEEIINDTLSVGDGLDLYSVGYDGYGNFRGEEIVDWSSEGLIPQINISDESTITFYPETPGTGNISIQESQSGLTAYTGNITVVPGTISYFDIGIINTQVAGEPFSITVTAYDENDNIKTDFIGTVDISDSSGTIQPQKSTNFVNGVWNGSVTVISQYTGNAITVTQTGAEDPAPKGVSNTFNVITGPGLRILDFKAVDTNDFSLIENVTLDQTKDWYLAMMVENLGSNEVRLDSLKLIIRVNGVIKDDYQLLMPEGFKHSETEVLPGLSRDTLLVTVDRTGADAGSASIQGFLYASTLAGKQITDQSLTSVTVQTPANLIVNEIITSQNQVTVGQDTSWTLAVVLSNRGESRVLIDSVSADVSSAVAFNLGQNWEVERPDSLVGGGWILEGETLDSLKYIVTHTGEVNTGECKINAFILGKEINTQRQISDNTNNAGWGTVIIEEEAELRIIELANIAPNAPYVNTGQQFDMRIKVANTGGDGLHDIKLLLTSEHPLFNFPTSIPINSLEGGDTTQITVSGNAFQNYLYNEIFLISGGGWTDNKNDSLTSVNPVDDTTKVTIQEPGMLTIENIITSTDTVMGGQIESWLVKVILANGQKQNPDYYAEIQIDTLKSKLSFWYGSLKLTDYITQCLTKNVSIKSAEKDTLIYKINLTGLYGGDVEIKADIWGIEKNSGDSKYEEGSTSIFVQSNPAFRIVSTKIDAYNTTEGGNGYLDINQEFKVVVSVENGLGHTVRDIKVHLKSEASDIENDDLTMIYLTPSQQDSLVFYLTASEQENINGEKFIASITSAKRNESEVPVGQALDSIAVAFIQTPADLSLNATLSTPYNVVTTNQEFTLTASLQNHGTGDVDTTGKVRITLPSPYSLTESSNTISSITINEPASWTIKSPDIASDKQEIKVTMYKPPLALNTGRVANIEDNTEVVFIETQKSYLKTYLDIVSPPGAVNRTVSSDQSFVVRTRLEYRNVRDITVEIKLPKGYETDNEEKKVISDEVRWTIQAPNGATDEVDISVNASGYDALNEEDVIIAAVQKTIEVQTVSKADLALHLNMEDKSLSPSQEFFLHAEVENKGEADTTGVTQVTLDELPEGYSTKESLVHFALEGITSWKIKAPPYSTGETATISASITKIPNDQNTSAEAYVSKQSASIGVTTVGTWLSVSEMEQPDSISSQVISEQRNVWLTGLRIINRGEEGSNGVILDKIKFILLDFDDQPLNPSSIFKTLRLCVLVEKQGTFVLDLDSCLAGLTPSQIPTENPVELSIENMQPIEAKDTLRIVLLADIADVENTLNFTLNMPDSSFITAVNENVLDVSLPVLSPSGERFEIKSTWQRQVVSSKDVGEGGESYLLNFPNPFGSPGKETTTIVYYLKKDTNVGFRIYNLIGELVWSKSYTSSEPQGREGLHSRGSNEVEWDGRNDYGHKVLNGVYILVLETGDGKVLKTKIAVVK